MVFFSRDGERESGQTRRVKFGGEMGRLEKNV